MFNLGLSNDFKPVQAAKLIASEETAIWQSG
jgi:hypothetical protein